MKERKYWWIIEQYYVNSDLWYAVGPVADTKLEAQREAHQHENYLEAGERFRFTKVIRA